MKKIQVLILFLSFSQLLIAQKNDGDNSAFLMPNGQFSVYFLDSVYADNYCIVESGINHQYIFIPDSSYQVSSVNKKYWDEGNCIFCLQRWPSLADYMVVYEDNVKKDYFKKIWPYEFCYHQFFYSSPRSKKNGKPTSKRDSIRGFVEQKPTLFARFLITGNAYNRLFFCIDCLEPETVAFKNPYAYYMVYVPIR